MSGLKVLIEAKKLQKWFGACQFIMNDDDYALERLAIMQGDIFDHIPITLFQSELESEAERDVDLKHYNDHLESISIQIRVASLRPSITRPVLQCIHASGCEKLNEAKRMFNPHLNLDPDSPSFDDECDRLQESYRAIEEALAIIKNRIGA